ncbi:MAG: hypothetical protein M0R80_02900 [Proteobacteria bacterium]|jgi:hypothetical protein|nr:hypothetical protein [Pseudomonadota bacterium]
MNEFIERVCNQMLKGIGNRGKAEVQLPAEKRAEFYDRFEALAAEITKCLPGSPDGTYSAALGAVACKCAIKYGADKAKEFLSVMKECKFQGQDDPAHLLWKFLNHPGPSFPTFYNKAVCAARAHCEGRRTLSELRNVKQDVFDWNDDYTGPAVSMRAQRKAAKEAGLPQPWAAKKNKEVQKVATLAAKIDTHFKPNDEIENLKKNDAQIMADFLTSDLQDDEWCLMAVAAAHHWKALHKKPHVENQNVSGVEVNNSVNGNADQPPTPV